MASGKELEILLQQWPLSDRKREEGIEWPFGTSELSGFI